MPDERDEHKFQVRVMFREHDAKGQVLDFATKIEEYDSEQAAQAASRARAGQILAERGREVVFDLEVLVEGVHRRLASQAEMDEWLPRIRRQLAEAKGPLGDSLQVPSEHDREDRRPDAS